MSVVMSLTSLEVEVGTREVPQNLHQLPRAPRLHGKNEMINDWMRRLDKLGVKYHEFFQKTGMEILKKGLHRMSRVSSHDDEVFRIASKIMWISQLNFCFQPVFHVDTPIKNQVSQISKYLKFKIRVNFFCFKPNWILRN
jgi:hypothetical protein